MSVEESAIARNELRWTAGNFAMIGVVFGAILFATIAMHDDPPSHIEPPIPQDPNPISET